MATFEVRARATDVIAVRVLYPSDEAGRGSVSAMARAGFDLIPGHYFVGRGEFMLSVGWLDLDRYWKLREEEPAAPSGA